MYKPVCRQEKNSFHCTLLIEKLRHSNHKQEINKLTGRLGHHYGGSGGCGYQNVSIILIEEVEIKAMQYLVEREAFWQHQLGVYVENRHNAHCFRKEL